MAEPLAELRPLLERVAAALERQAPPAPPASELQAADATRRLAGVTRRCNLPLGRYSPAVLN